MHAVDPFLALYLPICSLRVRNWHSERRVNVSKYFLFCHCAKCFQIYLRYNICKVNKSQLRETITNSRNKELDFRERNVFFFRKIVFLFIMGGISNLCNCSDSSITRSSLTRRQNLFFLWLRMYGCYC